MIHFVERLFYALIQLFGATMALGQRFLPAARDSQHSFLLPNECLPNCDPCSVTAHRQSPHNIQMGDQAAMG